MRATYIKCKCFPVSLLFNRVLWHAINTLWSFTWQYRSCWTQINILVYQDALRAQLNLATTDTAGRRDRQHAIAQPQVLKHKVCNLILQALTWPGRYAANTSLCEAILPQASLYVSSQEPQEIELFLTTIHRVVSIFIILPTNLCANKSTNTYKYVFTSNYTYHVAMFRITGFLITLTCCLSHPARKHYIICMIVKSVNWLYLKLQIYSSFRFSFPSCLVIPCFGLLPDYGFVCHLFF